MSAMERAKSFRFFGVQPRQSTSDERASQGDGGDTPRERTISLGAKQAKQRSTRQLAVKSAEERLRELYLKVPKDLDVELMRSAIAAAEEAKVDSDFVGRCKANLVEAEKYWEKKREAERLARMKERCEEATTQLGALLQFEPLAVDLSALQAAISVSGELAEEEGPHKVDIELREKATAFLTEAEAAHAARRTQALASLKKSSSCLLTVDADELRTACDFAKLAGVETKALSEVIL